MTLLSEIARVPGCTPPSSSERDRALTRERDITATERAAAARHVAAYSTSPTDLAELLDCLGLDEEVTA